jgi:hypothetical protein
MKGVPLRLLPGDDLRLALEAWMGAQPVAGPAALGRCDAGHGDQGRWCAPPLSC